jgi:hypothetical protein
MLGLGRRARQLEDISMEFRVEAEKAVEPRRKQPSQGRRRRARRETSEVLARMASNVVSNGRIGVRPV